jgi:hypothetical protein
MKVKTPTKKYATRNMVDFLGILMIILGYLISYPAILLATGDKTKLTLEDCEKIHQSRMNVYKKHYIEPLNNLKNKSTEVNNQINNIRNRGYLRAIEIHKNDKEFMKVLEEVKKYRAQKKAYSLTPIELNLSQVLERKLYFLLEDYKKLKMKADDKKKEIDKMNDDCRAKAQGKGQRKIDLDKVQKDIMEEWKK